MTGPIILISDFQAGIIFAMMLIILIRLVGKIVRLFELPDFEKFSYHFLNFLEKIFTIILQIVFIWILIPWAMVDNYYSYRDKMPCLCTHTYKEHLHVQMWDDDYVRACTYSYEASEYNNAYECDCSMFRRRAKK